MYSNCSRRKLLQVAVSSLGMVVLNGCLFGSASTPPAGSLIITNDHAESHVVTVTVTKTSEDEDEIRGHSETPDPETTAIWEREEQFTVDADDRTRQEDFITETGAFHLEAQLENGQEDSNWVGFYEAGDGIAEDTIFVSIFDDGRVHLSTSHSD